MVAVDVCDVVGDVVWVDVPEDVGVVLVVGEVVGVDVGDVVGVVVGDECAQSKSPPSATSNPIRPRSMASSAQLSLLRKPPSHTNVGRRTSVGSANLNSTSAWESAAASLPSVHSIGVKVVPSASVRLKPQLSVDCSAAQFSTMPVSNSICPGQKEARGRPSTTMSPVPAVSAKQANWP